MKTENKTLNVLEYMRSITKIPVVCTNISTVEEWTEFWLSNYCLNVKETTFSSYQSIVRLHINRVLGECKLATLSPEDVQLFIKSLHMGIGTEILSPKTIKNVHGVLHKCLEVAVTNKYINENPAQKTILPKIEKPDIHPLSNLELSTFLDAIQGDQKELLYLTTVFTGMREGEIIGLTWDCIDFEKGSIKIYRQIVKEKSTKIYKFSTLKNRKSRIIFPAPFLMNKLLYHKEHNPYSNSTFVFNDPKTKTHYTNPAVYSSFKKIMKNIGCPNIRFHDLRHTYAVLSLQANDDIKTLQYNMGHHSAAFTLDVYGHCIEEMKRTSSDKLSAFIESNFPDLE